MHPPTKQCSCGPQVSKFLSKCPVLVLAICWHCTQEGCSRIPAWRATGKIWRVPVQVWGLGCIPLEWVGMNPDTCQPVKCGTTSDTPKWRNSSPQCLRLLSVGFKTTFLLHLSNLTSHFSPPGQDPVPPSQQQLYGLQWEWSKDLYE